MPNKYYNDTTSSGPKGGPVNMPGGGKRVSMTYKTKSFPKVPGKKQSKDRSLGYPECKVYADKEGL